MRMEIIPIVHVAYIRHAGPYGHGNAQTMEQLKAWAGSRGLLDGDAVILGIAQDDPRTTPPQECRYDACLVVGDGFDPQDAQVRLGTAGGGKYAVFTVEHTAQAVRQAWSDIFPELTKQGFAPDTTRPIMERYAARMLANHCCELCVPVR